jgi:putative nucleotidyltransferase with HDIG domain
MPFREIPNVAKLATLTGNGVNKLFIDREEYGRYQEYLRENWKSLATDESVPVTQRVGVLSEVMRDVLSRSFQTAQADSIVEASQQLASGACELISHEPIVTRQLCSVLHHDYATFTHSTNVSLYALLLARELGFRGEELEQIAIGALLHDIGKLEIDERILTKPGRLDEFEFREVKKHPTTGFRALVSREDLNRAQLMMVYQHHERMDGSGYPVGCAADEIHPWAKLCAVVDVFEALTSDRPYRLPMTHKTAMTILDKGEATEFDADMLACWRTMVSQKA